MLRLVIFSNRWITFVVNSWRFGWLKKASPVQSTRPSRSSATGFNRQLSEWNLPPLMIRAFGALCHEWTFRRRSGQSHREHPQDDEGERAALIAKGIEPKPIKQKVSRFVRGKKPNPPECRRFSHARKSPPRCRCWPR